MAIRGSLVVSWNEVKNRLLRVRCFISPISVNGKTTVETLRVVCLSPKEECEVCALPANSVMMPQWGVEYSRVDSSHAISIST